MNCDTSWRQQGCGKTALKVCSPSPIRVNAGLKALLSDVKGDTSFEGSISASPLYDKATGLPFAEIVRLACQIGNHFLDWN
jgi:hypothetical protein